MPWKTAPRQLPLKNIILDYIDHQVDVVVRKTQFDLKKAKDRAHILEGLKIAMDHIDEVIHLIRSSKKMRQGLFKNCVMLWINTNPGKGNSCDAVKKIIRIRTR